MTVRGPVVCEGCGAVSADGAGWISFPVKTPRKVYWSCSVACVRAAHNAAVAALRAAKGKST